MIFLLIETTTEAQDVVRRKQQVHEDINVWLKLYEAELYQDRYMPEYQREERERLRIQEQQEAERKVRETAALKRVAAFSEEK
jgi:hypothetical protein